MKAKKEANWYDKVFKENLDAITLSLVEKVLGISIARQDDFRPDPALPAGWQAACPPDYTGSGFDRGHLCPWANRTAIKADNSATFLMTNINPRT